MVRNRILRGHHVLGLSFGAAVDVQKVDALRRIMLGLGRRTELELGRRTERAMLPPRSLDVLPQQRADIIDESNE